jgi:DNA-binding transcriptional regulator LsrR (DeoR family)
MSASKDLNEKLGEIAKKLDILIVIQLAKSGLTRKEVADVLGVSEKTIQRMLPFAKISQRCMAK